MKIAVIQTAVPDYRIPLFDMLARQVKGRGELVVYAGSGYFADSVVTKAEGCSWFRLLVNRFLVGRRLLWQQLQWRDLIQADALTIELNPRILSNWVLLLTRSIMRRTTVVWGHAWPREGADSPTTFLRVLMMLASEGIVVYTRTQQLELKQRWGIGSSPARNSVYSREGVKCAKNLVSKDFIYVGRLVEEKKVMLLVDAFALYVKEGGQANLHLVGDGPERGRIEKVVEEAGLRSRLIVYGHLGDVEQLAPIYSKAKYSISPGYVGLSAIQSFYMGVPMIVSRYESHAPEIEACEEGRNTLFFTERSSESLAALLRNAEEDCITIGWSREEIARHVRQRYSLEAMADALLGEVGYSHNSKPSIV